MVYGGQAMMLAPGPVGLHYQKLLRAKGKQKAMVAAARRFCTNLYRMLQEEWMYTEWLRHHDRPEVRPMQPLGSVAWREPMPVYTDGPPPSNPNSCPVTDVETVEAGRSAAHVPEGVLVWRERVARTVHHRLGDQSRG
jgi:hypothetical protein